MNKNENVVIGIFEDKEAALAGIEGLKRWDKASDDVKLGAIGLLYKEGDQVKTEVGHQSGRGAKVGAMVGVIAGVIAGPLGIAGGAAAGALGGGAVGAFFRQSLHLTEAECNSIGMDLDLGKAAVVVTCDEYEVRPTSLTLHQLGAEVKTYTVPEHAVHEVEAAVKQAREEQAFEHGIDRSIDDVANSLGGMM